MGDSEDLTLAFDVVLRRFRATGQWPPIADVERELFKTHRRNVEVARVVETSLPYLRWQPGAQGVAYFDVRALAFSGAADDELADFLSVVRLAVRKYDSDEETPRIFSQEAADEFGMDEARLRRVDALMKGEGIVTGGSQHESPYRWEYDVSDSVRNYADVASIEDYLRARSDDARPPMPVDAVSRRERASVQSARQAGPSIQHLHPLIVDVSQALFVDGHYAPSIFEACKAAEARVREMSGLDLSGQDLMAKAFSGDPAPIDVRHESGRSGEDEQDGFRFLFMGMVRGIRNPKGHDQVRLNDPLRAIEYLSFLSLLMRRLDDASDGSEADPSD